MEIQIKHTLSSQKKVYCALLELLKKYLTKKVNYFSVVVEGRSVALTLLPFTPFGKVTSIALLLCRASKAARFKFGLEGIGAEMALVVGEVLVNLTLLFQTFPGWKF